MPNETGYGSVYDSRTTRHTVLKNRQNRTTAHTSPERLRTVFERLGVRFLWVIHALRPAISNCSAQSELRCPIGILNCSAHCNFELQWHVIHAASGMPLGAGPIAQMSRLRPSTGSRQETTMTLDCVKTMGPTAAKRAAWRGRRGCLCPRRAASFFYVTNPTRGGRRPQRFQFFFFAEQIGVWMQIQASPPASMCSLSLMIHPLV